MLTDCCDRKLMEQATPCDRTNEKPDATGHSVHVIFLNIPWLGSLNQAKTFCIKISMTYIFVPLFQTVFAKGLLVLRYLEISVWKIYLHYFATSKWMYFSDKYFFYFVILVEWTFVICTKMHFDIQYSCPLLRIVLVSAMMDKNAVVAILDAFPRLWQ